MVENLQAEHSEIVEKMKELLARKSEIEHTFSQLGIPLAQKTSGARTDRMNNRDFILDLITKNPGIHTRDIGLAWRQSGRPSEPYNALSEAVKAGVIRRESPPGGKYRGSNYYLVNDET